MACERPSPRPGRQRLRRRQGGVSLVELMVAIVISLFMVAALITLYVNSSAARAELDRASRQIENGRFAIDVLRDDIALAGYFGELSGRDIAQYVEVDPCKTAIEDLGWSTLANPTPLRAPAPVQGANGSTDIPPGWSCSNLSQRASTGYLIVRRLQPATTAASAALALTSYLQSTGCLMGTVPFVLAQGPGAANFALTGADCATVSPIRAYVSRLYYVSTCGVCSPNDGIPTLKMRELRANTIVESVVADGIEDMQFEFGRDTDGDGQVDDFVATATAADWPNVVAVRIHLISRGASASPGYVDVKSYDRGSLFGSYTVAAGETQYKRRAYSAVVQLPNRAGPRETP